MSTKIKTSINEHDWTPLKYLDVIKYLDVLHHNRTQKQLRHFFLKILQEYYELPILGTLDMSDHFYQNNENL